MKVSVEPGVFTPAEAGRYLHVDVREVRRLILKGDLAAFRRGKQHRVSRAACDAWIQRVEEQFAAERAAELHQAAGKGT